jgi:Tfp pilus assembly PilM family ATPase
MVVECDLRFATMSTFLSAIEPVKQRFFKRSYGWTGIEIGCHAIRMAQVRKFDDRWQLATVWSVEHATPYVRSSEALSNAYDETFGWTPPSDIREKGLGSTLDLLENLDSLFVGGKCAASLSDGMIDYRELELPICAPKEVRSLLQSEITLETDCDFDDVTMDYWELPSNRPRSTTNSFGTASLNRNTAILLANDLLSAGFECRILDAIPCAMARATAMVGNDLNAATLGIELGYQQTTITLIHDGQPVLSRATRSVGLLPFLEQIAQSFEISIADAQTLLFQMPFGNTHVPISVDDFANPLQQKLSGFLQALAHEIDRTLQYVQRTHRTMAPTQVVLMGEGTRIPGIARTIENHIGLLTNTWSLDISENLFGNQQIATYAIASGLSSLAWEDG